MKNGNGKCAFVVYTEGERYIAYRDNLVRSLRKYVPGVEIVDFDPDWSKGLLPGMSERQVMMGHRLVIPMIDRFRGYDRVVWIDVDTDVTSGKFAGILDVETSDDGLAAARDCIDEKHRKRLEKRFPWYRKDVYFNSGVFVFDMKKIDSGRWRARLDEALDENRRDPFRWCDQDMLNAFFDIREIDVRYNYALILGPDARNGAWLVHYVGKYGNGVLDGILASRSDISGLTMKERCVVFSPRSAFIRPWIRAYFASGNNTPLVIVPGPPGDWNESDMEYCTKAAESCGGMVFDCSREWEASKRLSDRAVLRHRIGWYTKKSILHAVATRISPKSWAWIDDDIEILRPISECFEWAERAPGFIGTQFYYPSDIDNRHPERAYRSNIKKEVKIAWGSFMFFHGDANERLKALDRDFPVEDDEVIFTHLYENDERWHEGFCDFSTRNWQVAVKLKEEIPIEFGGKAIHYTGGARGGEVKKIWAAKAYELPPAPFETRMAHDEASDGPIDAVFVVGDGSMGDNSELKYALRNLDRNCKFVRDVYICGECPPFVDKRSVIHLPWPDRFSHSKDANIIDKLLHSCYHEGIAKRILFCSDDQFQTRECSWEDFRPRYLRRYASFDKWYEDRKRVWHSRLHMTLEREVVRRRRCGLDSNEVFYYQPHIWMPIDRDIFINYARWCDYEHRDDTIIASGYYNFADVEGVPDFDHTFASSDIKEIPHTTHVAYHDGSYKKMMTLLPRMFPEKSRFEL